MNTIFLEACRGEEVAYTPVWIMRQAGRYLPQYQAVRSQIDFLTLCKTPELAAKVTLQPVEVLGVDAAILAIMYSFKIDFFYCPVSIHRRPA